MAQDQITHTLEYLLSIGGRLTIAYGIWRAIGAVRRRRHPTPPDDALLAEAPPPTLPAAAPVARMSVPAAARRVAGDLAALQAEAADPQTPPRRLEELATDARLAAAVAANPAAPAPVLETLSRSWNSAAWQAIVTNPNATPPLLLRLGPQYPAEFFANPILPLLLIEQPDLLFRYDAAALDPLVRSPAAAAGFLAILTHHPDAALATEARLHVNLAGPLEGSDWRQAAEDAMWRLPPFAEKGLACLLERDHREHLLTVLQDVGVAPWLVPPLALRGNNAVRRAVASGLRVPRTVLAPLRRAGARGDLSGYTAPDPQAPIALLERLSEGSAWARGLAARHPATPASTLGRLATDRAVMVRCLVARNPATSPTILSTLAGDTHPRVRQEVARHARTAPGLLERLARDDDRHVRAAAAGNPATDAHTLAALAADPEWKVRREAARHPGLPSEAQETLAHDTVGVVLYALARRPALTPAARDHLAASADPIARRLIAAHGQRRHPAAPLASGSIAPGGRSHRLPTAPARQGGPEEPDRSRLMAALHELAEAADPVWRAVALSNPALEPERLSAHVRAPAWVERYAVARNPSAPQALLEMIGQDTNRLVRAAAVAALHGDNKGETP